MNDFSFVEKLAFFAVALAIVAATFVYLPAKGCAKSPVVEHYIDPIWMNKKKMYDDWYPRSNGSIYGNVVEPWDMFSGFPVYPRAY